MANPQAFQSETLLLKKCIHDEEEGIRLRDELESEIEMKNFTKQTLLKLKNEARVYKVTGPVRYQQPIEVVLVQLDAKINALCLKLQQCKENLGNTRAKKEYQRKRLIAIMSP